MASVTFAPAAYCVRASARAAARSARSAGTAVRRAVAARASVDQYRLYTSDELAGRTVAPAPAPIMVVRAVEPAAPPPAPVAVVAAAAAFVPPPPPAPIVAAAPAAPVPTAAPLSAAVVSNGCARPAARATTGGGTAAWFCNRR
jgi:hypothetical protein